MWFALVALVEIIVAASNFGQPNWFIRGPFAEKMELVQLYKSQYTVHSKNKYS